MLMLYVYCILFYTAVRVQSKMHSILAKLFTITYRLVLNTPIDSYSPVHEVSALWYRGHSCSFLRKIDIRTSTINTFY